MPKAAMRFVLAAALCVVLIKPADAHPHVFVDARAEIVFDANGAISAIKNIWKFDEPFSVYAKQGLKKLPNGRLTADSLQGLARVMIHSQAPYKFFTFQKIDGKLVGLGDGADETLADDGERLTLSFTVAPASPIPTTAAPITIALYDPEYFVAMSFVKDKPVKFEGAPDGCKMQLFTPTGLSAAAAAALALVPASQRTLPPELQSLTGGIENGVVVDCRAQTR
jgi:ABC-type uncharacterized transport system substrate-binding protein